MTGVALDVTDYPVAAPDWMPVGRELTVTDLDHSPDDGRRYELIDGVLLVSPSPIWGHQASQLTLAALLKATCPRDLRVVAAPFDWRISPGTKLVPDIIVARFADLAAAPGRKYLDQPPLLVVEVLSPNTHRYDRSLKMATYADAGAVSYWLVDPRPDELSVETYSLVAGAYRPGPGARGRETLTVTAPFPVSFSPWDLLADLRE